MQDMASIFSMNKPGDEIHEIFEMNKTGVSNLQQILLGMNISGVTMEGQCHIVFEFYYENKSDFLTQDEIKQLLMGTHLQSSNAVLSKAKTVMTYADMNNADGIGFNQLLEVALNFPHLMFPTGELYQLS